MVQVILPPPESSQTPIKVPVITTSPTETIDTSPPHQSASSAAAAIALESSLGKLSNGLSPPPSSSSATAALAILKNEKSLDPKTEKEMNKVKTPQTPKSPLCPEAKLVPALYKYVVEHVDVSSGLPGRTTVKASVLSRPRGVLTPKKLKVFLRNATHRVSEKHPIAVKVRIVARV